MKQYECAFCEKIHRANSVIAKQHRAYSIHDSKLEYMNFAVIGWDLETETAIMYDMNTNKFYKL